MPRPSRDSRPADEARPPGRSFRLVCPPDAIPAVEALLAAQGFPFEPEPFSPWCRRLTGEPGPLGGSLAAFFGLIHIQDRSSMLPPLLLDPPPGASVLDMCAAPGGKTGFLAQLVGPTGFVLANEPSKDRLTTLRQTLLRENLAQVATIARTDLAPVLPEAAFDHILLDPPCSGWGTLDKHPQAARIWRGDKVGTLLALQRTLLATAARLLAPGGRLLYSTCTTNAAENEDQTRFALDHLPLRSLPLAPPPGFVFEPSRRDDLAGILRVDSNASAAQGFYMALFQKEPRRPLPGNDLRGLPGDTRLRGDLARRRRRPGRPAAGRGGPGLRRERLPAAGPNGRPAAGTALPGLSPGDADGRTFPPPGPLPAAARAVRPGDGLERADAFPYRGPLDRTESAGRRSVGPTRALLLRTAAGLSHPQGSQNLVVGPLTYCFGRMHAGK